MQIPIGNSLLSLISGDITTLNVDGIVNAANSGLAGGGGVDGAIHRAGGPSILEECRAIVNSHGRLPTGEAVATTAGKLMASHLIHTVGPIWRGGDNNEPALLANCYRNSLLIASREGLTSLAFPAISCGVYGYPFADACRISFSAVRDFAEQEDNAPREIYFIYYSPDQCAEAIALLPR
ncbi:MAG: O-acetyl-ADP-ribose deacetylase [bacterium]|nr:O-acetyl-ADP-ribose deacetylase [bacterium]